MNGYSSFEVHLAGSRAEIIELTDTLSEALKDQVCFDQQLTIEEDDDGDDDFLLSDSSIDRYYTVYRTQSCIWVEDLTDLAKELARFAPGADFSIKGCIYDTAEDDVMDFRIVFRKRKLTVETSDWYIIVNMKDYAGYKEFCEQFSDQEGNPRYSEEDYLGFKECADEWYVLDSGKGEFSTDVPLGDPKKIKVPLK